MGFSLARIQRAAAAALKKQGIDSKRDAEIAELRFQLAALQEENGLLRQEVKHPPFQTMEEHKVPSLEHKQLLEAFNAKHLERFKAAQRKMTMTDKLAQGEFELAASLTRGQMRIVATWLLDERRTRADAGYGNETINTLLTLAQRLERLAKSMELGQSQR